MRDRIITFFDRQEVAANPSSSAEIYSPVFDVQGASRLILEMQVLASSQATSMYTALVTESASPTLGDNSWSNLAVSTVATSGGVGRSKAAISNPERFVRVKLTVSPGVSGLFSCRGIARS